MRWCRKDKQGDCLATLKALLGGTRRVQVELREGLMFIDEVIGVEDGAGAAIFSQRGRVEVSAIEVVQGV